jgi:hypothetical protein
MQLIVLSTEQYSFISRSAGKHIFFRLPAAGTLRTFSKLLVPYYLPEVSPYCLSFFLV